MDATPLSQKEDFADFEERRELDPCGCGLRDADGLKGSFSLSESDSSGALP